MMKNAVRRNIESGLLPSSAGRNLDSMTVGEFRKLQNIIMEKQQELDRQREQWEREHSRDRGGIELQFFTTETNYRSMKTMKKCFFVQLCCSCAPKSAGNCRNHDII